MADHPSSDVAFTPAVKAVQAARGSRAAYEKLEARGGFRTEVTEELLLFLAGVDTAYLATASAEGQPYVQHRGGPKGFIQVVGPKTLGFADFTGNRQYITTGNLSENPRACLFLMDYARKARVKLWGAVEVVENDPSLISRLTMPDYEARVQQAMLFHLTAWDINCPQHIPQKLDAAEVAGALEHLQHRIAALEAENAALKAKVATG